MEFESSHQNKNTQKLFCVIGVTIIAFAAAWASYIFSHSQVQELERLLIVCLLIAAFGAYLFWVNLNQISAQTLRVFAEVTPAAPSIQASMQAQLLTLESRLEHSPIALFSVVETNSNKIVNAINGNARRLIAPGRASKPEVLFEQIADQIAGKRSVILFETEQGIERALLACSTLSIGGASQTMVALMPVESELQLEAQNAWLKLIHVLTHEIMNSLTPVASLSRTANDLLVENQANLPELDYQDLTTALDAISRRARGLADFVSSYRSLSNVPAANPELVNLSEVLARLHALALPAWTERGGKVQVSCDPASMSVMIDPDQFEQALINLMKNAEEATAGTERPELSLHAKLTRGGRMRLEISDNGPGVPDELISQIFTPFFSTKQRGSGIGLALVRQLIQGNGGTVRYAHRVQGGAQFIITI